MICYFCADVADILCDGLLYGNKTCDRPMCRKCAGPADALVTDALFRCGTVDLCRWCRRAGRQAKKLEASEPSK